MTTAAMPARHAIGPADIHRCQASDLCDHFLIQSVFEPEQVVAVYTPCDREAVGGVMLQYASIELPAYDNLKTAYFGSLCRIVQR